MTTLGKKRARSMRSPVPIFVDMKSLNCAISVGKRVKDTCRCALLMDSRELLPKLCFLLVCGGLTCSFSAQAAGRNADGYSIAQADMPGLPGVVADIPEGPVKELIAKWRNEEDGIRVSPTYTGEVFTNTRGGLSTKGATNYLALLELALELDFDAMDVALPGKIFVLAQNTHGQGITEDYVGDVQFISNIDSHRNIMQVSEYWWEFEVGESGASVRLGKQDVSTEFFFIDLATDFIQSTFGLSPSTAFPTYPDPSMGAVILMPLQDAWRLKMGAWNSFSSGGNWGFSGSDAVLAVGELEYKYALAGGMLPGVADVGAVYESAGEVSGEPISPVHEYILQWEQHLYRESPGVGDDLQGLAAFAGYYPRFPGFLITQDSMGGTFVAGLIYRGLLPDRDEDVVGAGVVRAELFQGGTNHESVVELFYKAQLTPRLMFQPDLQYVVSPSGVHRDALAVGLRFALSL